MRQTREVSASAATVVAIALVSLFAERIPSFLASFYGPRGLRLILNIATALLVVSLPFAAASATQAAQSSPDTAPVAAVSTIVADDAGGARPQTVSRGVVAGTRSVVTVAAADVAAIPRYTVKKGDTLTDIAQQFGVDSDDIAYANAMDNDNLGVGDVLTIPPGRGALYVVKPGDTVTSVASKFKVDAAAIMNYNRLYFEPEHFAIDQLIFIPGAEVPVIRRSNYGVVRIGTTSLPPRTGRLSWPVNGVITQLFWWGHTGVDLAAPYGTTIGASDDGVVSATGWVAVGGLRVCVAHSEGLETCYYHTSAVFVSPGQKVVRGQALAAIGMTGVTTGPHVHWELKVNGTPVNPLSY